MNDFTFELEPFENDAQRGEQGTIGSYGQANVFYVKSVRPQGAAQIVRTQLVSEYLPESFFLGVGNGGRPSLSRASIEVGSVTGTVKHNAFGLRRAARALRIAYEDRTYIYASNGFGGSVELRRDGAQVAIENGEFIRDVGRRRKGSARGTVDEVDLAIALVIDMVDVTSLSLGTALATAPFKLLTMPGDGGVA